MLTTAHLFVLIIPIFGEGIVLDRGFTKEEISKLCASGDSPNTETIVTKETEISCPSAQGMARIETVIEQNPPVSNTDWARLRGRMNVYGCETLTKGIKLEVIEKQAIEGSKSIIILARLPSGTTAYIARSQDKSESNSLPIVEQQILPKPKEEVNDEYKTRHVLLKSKDKAGEIINRANKGEDFSSLAKKYSTGPSGSRGGDLGWLDRTTLIDYFGDAVTKMKEGSHSSSPVKTEFGWHVIKLEGVREKR
ncbi:MAG: Peptidylprolyl isomerase [uncultured Thiotrichaceae bacterium]|uniref:peptidylprolyl isomerase n=1 Tax=uncultured Thiotrichaceae bacterium TaxID=298394 RepID=A0A6S6TUD6_9GAMM|nr:MAG: Peptidylprolyl isomerase [uncultured Thiotrichaceae bacterium]